MRHRYLSVFSVVLLSFSLIFCIATGTYGDTVPSEEYGQFLGSTKLEQEIIALREQYLNAGDALVNRKDYRSACITYQKLLDILFRKSVDSNLDVWMGAYGPLYKQADLRQKTARKLFEESRKSVLASACESRKKARLSSPAAIPAVRERRALKEKGDLSVDGTLIISTFNTQSPPINSNQIIGVYLAQSGQKIFDDTPIIDDRKNPQISRWKGVYIVTDPRWSPDGTRYAYCINGALCVSDDGSAKPALVSSIPDSETLEDRLIDWSPDSRKLLYSRNLKEGKTIYWNTLNGEKERKLITGDWAAFSSDSQRVAISRASKLTVINLKDGKSEQAGSGDECSFSPDDQTLLVLRKGKGTARGGDSLFARGLAGGRERELLTSAAPFLSKLDSPSLSSPVWLAKTLIAFNVSHQKDGKTKSDIWAYSLTSNKAAPLTADGSSTLAPWLQSPSRVLTQKELIILSR